MPLQRKIIHVDMDAFYAQVEQRDNPALKGQPVIVGGNPQGRGVVAACSYEARHFGIHSAMPAAKAKQLCPQAIFVPVNMAKYRKVSSQLQAIFHRYTDLIEPLSLDEAFLDVTQPKQGPASGTLIAEQIRAAIFNELHLTCSAGVANNKFVAKIASDINKPNGLTVITPAKAEVFLLQLPINKFFGVGKVTAQKMHRLGINTGADLIKFSLAELTQHFGKAGASFYYFVRGKDTRPVNANRQRKSIGREQTYAENLTGLAACLSQVEALSQEVAATASKHQKQGLTVTLKIRYHDFTTLTRASSLSQPTNSFKQIFALAQQLLTANLDAQRPVRLLGVTLSNFTSEAAASSQQLEMQF